MLDTKPETIRTDGYMVQLHPCNVEATTDTEAQQKRAALARELGLHMYADTLSGNRAPETATTWCKQQGLVPLTSKELRLWEQYLPMSYWSDATKAPHVSAEQLPHIRTFRDYTFHEGVPTIILERMKATSQYFTFEIRTPEVATDPVLLGHVIWPDGRRDIYLLGRWGRDSDPNFLPDVAAIEKILRARKWVGNLSGAIFSLSALMLIPLFVAMGLLLNSGLIAFFGGFLGLSLAGAIAVFAQSAVQRSVTAHHMKDEPDLAKLV